MLGKSLIFKETSSQAGKSFLITGLCRFLKEEGHNVSSLRAFHVAGSSSLPLSQEGEPSPLLLKPLSGGSYQVFINGEYQQDLSPGEPLPSSLKEQAEKAIQASLARLKSSHQLLLLEGDSISSERRFGYRASFPLIINNQEEAPIILVADIHRGGVFAVIIGALELMPGEQRKRVKGIIINKFQGDPSRLKPGIDYIQQKTGVPVLGVVPYYQQLSLPQNPCSDECKEQQISVAVIKLPHAVKISAFESLKGETGVELNYLEPGEDLSGYQLLFLPGSTRPLEDLKTLYQSGTATLLCKKVEKGVPLAGIGGGHLFLGDYLSHPDGERIRGLGLLWLRAEIKNSKEDRVQVSCKLQSEASFFSRLRDKEFSGTLLDQARISRGPGVRPLFHLLKGEEQAEGVIGRGGLVWGTGLQDILGHRQLRRAMLKYHCGSNKRVQTRDGREGYERKVSRLAEVLPQHLDIKRVYKILALQVKGG